MYSGSIGPCTTAEVPLYSTQENASPAARRPGDPIKLRDRTSGAFDSSGRRPSQRRTSTGMRSYPLSEWRFARRASDNFVIRTCLQSTSKTTRSCLQVLRDWRSARLELLLRGIDATRRMPAEAKVQSFRLIVTPLLEILGLSVGNSSRPDHSSELVDVDPARNVRAVQTAAFSALVAVLHDPGSDPMQAAHVQCAIEEYVRDFLRAPTAGVPLLRLIANEIKSGYDNMQEGVDQREVEKRRSSASRCLQVLPNLARIAVACCLQNQLAG